MQNSYAAGNCVCLKKNSDGTSWGYDAPCCGGPVMLEVVLLCSFISRDLHMSIGRYLNALLVAG
jgi:hypothetical protein